jgi:hypothetical protein
VFKREDTGLILVSLSSVNAKLEGKLVPQEEEMDDDRQERPGAFIEAFMILYWFKETSMTAFIPDFVSFKMMDFEDSIS